MQPPLFSPKEESTKLPPDIQRHVDAFSAFVIDEERQEYNNSLVPFAQHAAEIKAHAQASFGRLQNQLQRALKLLKGHFEQQESQGSQEAEDSSFMLFEKAYEALRKKMQEPDFSIIELFQAGPIQKQIKLPWAFMDRAYKIAKHLLDEKSFEEAQALFTLLQLLNSEVFEYWVGEGCALQGQGKLEEAVNSYTASLLLQPRSAFIFFQIATCLYQANEIPACLKALELCLQYAKEDPAQAALMKEAEDAMQALEKRAA